MCLLQLHICTCSYIAIKLHTVITTLNLYYLHGSNSCVGIQSAEESYVLLEMPSLLFTLSEKHFSCDNCFDLTVWKLLCKADRLSGSHNIWLVENVMSVFIMLGWVPSTWLESVLDCDWLVLLCWLAALATVTSPPIAVCCNHCKTKQGHLHTY